MRIVVIDDESLTCEAIYQTVDRWVLWHKLPFEVYTGHSLSDLRALLTSDTVLAILDIRLPEGSAVDRLDELRAAGFWGDVIFITAYPVSTAAVANVQPFGFVDKRQAAENFSAGLIDLLEKWLDRHQPRFFRYTFNKTSHVVALNNILYFKKEMRRIVPVLTDGEGQGFRGSLEDILDGLDDGVFVLVGNSYLINTRHIKHIHAGEIRFSTGSRLQISKYLQKDLERALFSVTGEAEE